MSFSSRFSPTPVSEISDDGVNCEECGELLSDEAYYDGVGAFFCEECIRGLVESKKAEAIDFAEKNCKITQLLPKYDPRLEYRCTPDEYAAGSHESYTPSAFMAYCRHNCTNYDELIEGLSRDRVADRVWHHAIQTRITEILEVLIQVSTDDPLDDEGVAD